MCKVLSIRGKKRFPMIERIRTGTEGLDILLGGGVPKGRVTLVIGSPGSGKTILGARFLYCGAVDSRESGIYISMDESREEFTDEMSTFGWDFEKLEKERKFAFIDASPIRHAPEAIKLGQTSLSKREFSLLSLIEGIRSNANSLNAKRIVLDPITGLIFQYSDLHERRTAILDLIQALTHTKCTCLVTTELKMTGSRRVVQEEEYLAHGVILMRTMQVGKSSLRIIEIEKMRGIQIDTQARPYRITGNGIEVYPHESVF